MKKELRKALVLVVAGVMTIAPVMTANAEQWRDDARGWWIEKDDGSYLVNQWYQSPSSGLWYYMGPDGYMLTNTVTPDGCYVDANGVWVQNANTGTQQTVGAAKDVAAIQQVAEAYKDYDKTSSGFVPDSYVFVDIDSDGIPECICTNGTGKLVLTFRSGKVTRFYESQEIYNLLYVPNGNTLCSYYHSSHSSNESREFYEINDNGSFNWIGRSYFDGKSTYRTANRSNTTKAVYDDYNNSFGTFTEISVDYDDTYRSIDAACAAYLAQ